MNSDNWPLIHIRYFHVYKIILQFSIKNFKNVVVLKIINYN